MECKLQNYGLKNYWQVVPVRVIVPPLGTITPVQVTVWPSVVHVAPVPAHPPEQVLYVRGSVRGTTEGYEIDTTYVPASRVIALKFVSAFVVGASVPLVIEAPPVLYITLYVTLLGRPLRSFPQPVPLATIFRLPLPEAPPVTSAM